MAVRTVGVSFEKLVPDAAHVSAIRGAVDGPHISVFVLAFASAQKRFLRMERVAGLSRPRYAAKGVATRIGSITRIQTTNVEDRALRVGARDVQRRLCARRGAARTLRKATETQS